MCYACITIVMGTHVHLAVCGGQSYQESSVVTLLPRFLKEDFNQAQSLPICLILAASQPASGILQFDS